MTLVVTSGYFDPLHVGHIKHFLAAKALGDKHIVILNSDENCKAKKGYVFMPFEEKLEIIKNLRCVDMVVKCIDIDGSCAKTLECVHPDIFAKGGDRNIDNIPESERMVCKRLGIKVVNAVGGEKIQSSSKLVEGVK